VTWLIATRQEWSVARSAENIFRRWQVVAVAIVRRCGGAVLSVDDGRGRGNLIECPRPGCPMLSGVVAATWGRRRPDMSYGSVVLHGGDHGAAMVVLPVPRLRSIYTASRNIPAAPATVSSTLLYIRRIIETLSTWRWTPYVIRYAIMIARRVRRQTPCWRDF
jgi:hypothetical protein